MSVPLRPIIAPEERGRGWWKEQEESWAVRANRVRPTLEETSEVIVPYLDFIKSLSSRWSTVRLELPSNTQDVYHNYFRSLKGKDVPLLKEFTLKIWRGYGPYLVTNPNIDGQYLQFLQDAPILRSLSLYDFSEGQIISCRSLTRLDLVLPPGSLVDRLPRLLAAHQALMHFTIDFFILKNSTP